MSTDRRRDIATLRPVLLATLNTALAETPFLHAAWLEGADAAGHADEWSDIDLWLDVEPGHEEDAIQAVIRVLETFGPLTLHDEAHHPDPQIRQCFLASAGLPAFNFVDLCMQTHGRDVAFTPADPVLVWFDRGGVLRWAKAEATDHAARLKAMQRQSWRFLLVEKELQRGHQLEAASYYRSEVLGRLVTALRLVYSPLKAEYGLKHIERDLPPDVLRRLEQLHRAWEPADLRRGVQEAREWLSSLSISPKKGAAPSDDSSSGK